MVTRTRDDPRPHDLGGIWDVVRDQGTDIATLKQIATSQVSEVKHLGAKLDEVLEIVTRHTARQGPSIGQIAGTSLSILGVVGAIAAGISIYVSSIYDGKLVDLQSKADRSEMILAQRDVEDRSELNRLREAERFSFGDRLRKLEEHTGWAPHEILPAAPAPTVRR